MTRRDDASTVAIERVERVRDDVVQELADVLLDAVTDGASVSFMADLRRDDAVAWWRMVLSDMSPRAVVLVARDEHGIVGTVQLQPAWAPNQPHRADVAKLLVHRRARRRGIGRALMEELERFAREQRFSLLVLDTAQGSAAERLYTEMGWTRVGEVPDFALNPDRSWNHTVFFYKQL